MLFTRNLWPGVIWALVVLILTGLPGSYFPVVHSFWDWLSPDKVIHLVIFGVQSFLILWGFRTQYSHPEKRLSVLSWATIASVLYGGLTELLQKEIFVGRDGNLYDFLANVIGALIGIFLFRLLFRKKTT